MESDRFKEERSVCFHDAWEHLTQQLDGLTFEKKELEHELNILELRYVEDINKVLKKADQMKEELERAINSYEYSRKKLDESAQQMVALSNDLKSMQTDRDVEVAKNTKLCEELTLKNTELIEVIINC